MPRKSKKAAATEQLSMDDLLNADPQQPTDAAETAPQQPEGTTEPAASNAAAQSAVPQSDAAPNDAAQSAVQSTAVRPEPAISLTLTPKAAPREDGAPARAEAPSPAADRAAADEAAPVKAAPPAQNAAKTPGEAPQAPDAPKAEREEHREAPQAQDDPEIDPLEPLPLPRKKQETLRLVLDHPAVTAPKKAPKKSLPDRRGFLQPPRNAKPGWQMRRVIRRLTVSTARLIDAHNAASKRLIGAAVRVKNDTRSRADVRSAEKRPATNAAPLHRLPPITTDTAASAAANAAANTAARTVGAKAAEKRAPDRRSAAKRSVNAKAPVKKPQTRQTPAKPAERRKTAKPEPLTRLAGTLGGLLLLQSLLTVLFSWGAGRCTGNTALLLDSLGGALPPLLCFLLGLPRIERPRFRAGSYHGDTTRLKTLYALVIALLAAVGELTGSALRLALPLDTAGALTPVGWGGWLTVLGLNCILLPLAQELLYRGLLQPALTDWGERFAILLTGLLFALSGHSLAAFLPRLALSVVLGLAALRLGGVRVTVPLHILYQLLATLLLVSTRNSADLVTLGLLVLILAVCLIFGCYGAVLLLKMKLPRPERRRDPRNRPGRMEQLLTSPLFFAALICLITLVLLQSLTI